jgi:hypothetical protein
MCVKFIWSETAFRHVCRELYELPGRGLEAFQLYANTFTTQEGTERCDAFTFHVSKKALNPFSTHIFRDRKEILFMSWGYMQQTELSKHPPPPDYQQLGAA